MNEEQLNRLIEVLQDIDSNLTDISISLKNLDNGFQNCISNDPNGKSFLHVGGAMINYTY